MAIQNKNIPRKILVMCIAAATGNPRPYRTIHLLHENGFEVDAVTLPLRGSLPIKSTFVLAPASMAFLARVGRKMLRFVGALAAYANWSRLVQILLAREFRFHSVIESLSGENYDVIVVENIEMLPAAFKLIDSGVSQHILFDAREYYPKQYDQSIFFRLFSGPLARWICATYLQRCSRLITVSPAIARKYRDEFAVEMDVVRSIPTYCKMECRPTNLDSIRMVHHGAANANRGLSNMIETCRRLDERFTLDLYLVGSQHQIDSLKMEARDCNRIQFKEPVPFDAIIKMLNMYDIGLYYLEPSGFNVKYCLPNKFFEFIQARLAVAIGPSPEMADLVSEHGVGFVAPEFSIDAMVEMLAALTTSDIDSAKKNSDSAAAILCFENESTKLLQSIEALLK